LHLEKTLSNLRKTRESFFILKKGDLLFFDIYKNNLKYYLNNKNNIIIISNSKIVNKHFIDWDWNGYDKLIKTLRYNYWIERFNDFDLGCDIPFHYNAKRHMGSTQIPKIL
jgi:hypothetical protein